MTYMEDSKGIEETHTFCFNLSWVVGGFSVRIGLWGRSSIAFSREKRLGNLIKSIFIRRWLKIPRVEEALGIDHRQNQENNHCWYRCFHCRNGLRHFCYHCRWGSFLCSNRFGCLNWCSFYSCCTNLGNCCWCRYLGHCYLGLLLEVFFTFGPFLLWEASTVREDVPIWAPLFLHLVTVSAGGADDSACVFSAPFLLQPILTSWADETEYQWEVYPLLAHIWLAFHNCWQWEYQTIFPENRRKLLVPEKSYNRESLTRK